MRPNENSNVVLEIYSIQRCRNWKLALTILHHNTVHSIDQNIYCSMKGQPIKVNKIHIKFSLDKIK